MTDNNKRTETARRHDDHELIDSFEPTPAQGERSGGKLQQDIGTQAEEEHMVDGKPGITRVRKEDKKH